MGEGWNLGFWCEGQAFTTITLSDFDTGQCAAFEIQRTAQVGKFLSQLVLKCWHFQQLNGRLLGRILIHLIFHHRFVFWCHRYLK